MKKVIYILIVIVVVVGIWFGVGKRQGDKGTIKIGIASLMSGDFAVVGENIRDTAYLFVDQINEKGGIGGKKLELVTEDSKCDSKTGLSAVSKLINIDKVKYIIGGMCSNGTVASAPIANEKKVLIFTPVTGGQNVDLAGEYIFRMANSDILAGQNITDAIYRLGFKKVYIVTETTEYTLDIKKSLEDKLNDFSLLSQNEDFLPNNKDFRSSISKLKEFNPDVVVVLSQTGISGAYFIKQLREQNINKPIFTDFTLVSNSDAKKIVGSFEGVYFADPAYDSNNSELKKFFNEFKNRFGHEPIVPFHTASTYDSLNILVNAIENVGDDSGKVRYWISKNVKNYSGFMGDYSLDENGNSDLGFVIKKITKDGYEIVK